MPRSSDRQDVHSWQPTKDRQAMASLIFDMRLTGWAIMSRGLSWPITTTWARWNWNRTSPLEFPLGNGDPGPHDSLEVWVLWVFNVWNLHSLEEDRSLFDLIWWKLEVPFYRDSGLSTAITSEFRFHQMRFPPKKKFHFLEFTGSMRSLRSSIL